MFILPYKLLGFIAGINCLFYNLLVIPDNDFIVLFCVQFHMFRTVIMILYLKKKTLHYIIIYIVGVAITRVLPASTPYRALFFPGFTHFFRPSQAGVFSFYLYIFFFFALSGPVSRVCVQL